MALDRTGQIETNQHELESRTKELGQANQSIETLQKRVSELADDLVAREAAAASAAKERDDNDDGKMAALADENQRLQNELEQRDSTLADYQSQLENAQASQPDATAEINQGLIEQQRVQIERLTEQLQTVANTPSIPEADDRDEQIAELEELVRRKYIRKVPVDRAGRAYRYDPADGSVAPPTGRVLDSKR